MYIDQSPQFELVCTHLKELFEIDAIRSMELLRGGHLCKSFIIRTDSDVYFLKQYRHRLSNTVHQIKFAEEFFFKRGVPVLMPLKDVYGRSAFLMGQNWYSLFPFLEFETKRVEEIEAHHVRLLGEQLGEMHRVSVDAPSDIQPILLWNKERFLMEAFEIERLLGKKAQLNETEQLIFDMLKKKRAFAERSSIAITDSVLPFDVLMHGDFGYQNVFFSKDASRIEAVYDFEKANRGPRSFELARALFVSCFDDGWEEKNLVLGATFLRAYLGVFWMPLEEFRTGVELYLTNLAHQTWLEGKVLIRQSYNYTGLLAVHAARIDHLTDDLDEFTKNLYERANG